MYLYVNKTIYFVYKIYYIINLILEVTMLKIKSLILICFMVLLFGCDNGSSSSQSSAEQPAYPKLFNISSYNLTVGDNTQLDYNT